MTAFLHAWSMGINGRRHCWLGPAPRFQSQYQQQQQRQQGSPSTANSSNSSSSTICSCVGCCCCLAGSAMAAAAGCTLQRHQSSKRSLGVWIGPCLACIRAERSKDGSGGAATGSGTPLGRLWQDRPSSGCRKSSKKATTDPATAGPHLQSLGSGRDQEEQHGVLLSQGDRCSFVGR